MVTFRRWSPKGSLKDFIHKSAPTGLYEKKYASVAKLPLERIALFGRQILEVCVSLSKAYSRRVSTSCASVAFHTVTCTPET